MLVILAPAVLFPGQRIGRKMRIQSRHYIPIPLGSIVALTMTAVHPDSVLQLLNMRLIARFVVLMVAVFGVSLAFAWAWDKSDKSQDTAAHAAT
jgi:hypothetical protein